MKLLKNITLTTILFSLVVSCAELKDLANIQQPSVNVEDFRVTGLSLKDIELTFDLQVDNPNPVALTLSSYDYDLQIEENSFVKGNQSLSSKVEANGKNIISIPVTFTFNELYQTFNSIKEKDETGYQFFANIGVNVPVLGLIEIPIQKTGEFPVVKAPSLSISNFSVKNLSFTKADIELEVEVKNPNTFGVILNGLNYNVDVNGFSPVSGKTSDRIEISEKGAGKITIPASFNLVELGLGAYQALNSDKPFDYSLKGSADIGATLPFFESSLFNFEKNGLVNINN